MPELHACPLSPLSLRQMLALSLAAAAGLLAACGGGGGDDPAAPPAPSLVRENYALVTVAPPASYAVATAEAGFYATLNTVRLGMGAGALTQDARLDTAASRHLAYLTANYPDIGSNQTAGKPGFYAATPTARAGRAGYVAGKLSEFVGSTTGPTATVEDCLRNLLENPYALNALAEPWRDIGIAYGVLKAAVAAPAPAASGVEPTPDPALPAAACIMVVAVKEGINGQLPDADTLKTYPFPGQQDVASDFGPGPQGQQPAPDLQNKTGSPLQVSMGNFGSLTQGSYAVDSFVLKDAMGRAVPARLIVNRATQVALNVVYFRDPMYLLPPSDVMLLPLSPLAKDAQYTAEFQGANGTQRFAKSWTFTTKPGALATPSP